MRPDAAERGASRSASPGRPHVAGVVPAPHRSDERVVDALRGAEDPNEGDLLYWKSRAQELEAQLAAARARLLALADHLPPALVAVLGRDPDALAGVGCQLDVLEDWDETTLLKPATVAVELPRLWQRLRRTAAT
ncbi:MAG TPA: hypothetical protein VFD92_26290 [Candidatus Binatia bacterium]|nr:hypothetical protein [Candidatus Binatia bacterium]